MKAVEAAGDGLGTTLCMAPEWLWMNLGIFGVAGFIPAIYRGISIPSLWTEDFSRSVGG